MDVVSSDYSSVEHVTHYVAIVLNGMGPTSFILYDYFFKRNCPILNDTFLIDQIGSFF